MALLHSPTPPWDSPTLKARRLGIDMQPTEAEQMLLSMCPDYSRMVVSVDEYYEVSKQYSPMFRITSHVYELVPDPTNTAVATKNVILTTTKDVSYDVHTGRPTNTVTRTERS